MLIGGVVGDEIENEFDAVRMQRVPDTLEIIHRAVARIDGAEIRDVVAEILIGTGVDRRQPYGADTEPFQIVDPLQQTGKIAVAVAIAVLKGNGGNFVDDSLAPP